MSVRPTVIAVVLAGVALAAPASAAAPSPAGYLLGAQNADGGLPAAPGGASSGFVSGWAAIGLAAAGHDPRQVARGAPTLAAYLAAAATQATSAGDVERTLLALAASGTPAPPELLTRLAAHRRANGSYDGRVNTTAFAILALRAAGRARTAPELRAAARWLVTQQGRDGGFGFGGRMTASDADDTGAVLEALATAGRSRTSRLTRRAVAWLVRTQRPDGGYGLTPRTTSNAQSTAFAAQGLIAAGRDPDEVHHRGGRSPLAFLRSLIGPSGAVRYSRTSVQTPVWVTAQALAALSRRALPVTAP